MMQTVSAFIAQSQTNLIKLRQLSLDVFHMSKPTVGLLVMITAIPAMLMSDAFPQFLPTSATLLGIFFVNCASAVFNQLIDRDIDHLMNRTKLRPLPSLRMSANLAWSYGLVTLATGLGLLYFLATPLAAFIALVGFGFYLAVYSLLLKKRTSQNIVIGGAAGAVGPLIGSAAAVNAIHAPAWLLFALIFFWTPPHFWSLALKYKDDYARANIPMLPVVAGEGETRRKILLYTFTLYPIVIGLYAVGAVSLVTLLIMFALTSIFTLKAYRLYRSGNSVLCMDVFHYSCLYLFSLFCIITLDRLLI